MLEREQIKKIVDLHDLAKRLGLKRPDKTGNYRSPHHTDKGPSLSIFNEGKLFRDHSSNEPAAKGDCFSLVMWVTGCDFREAFKQLHEIYGWEWKPPQQRERKPESLVQMVARLSQANDIGPAIEYLHDERGIPRAAARAAYKAGTLAYSTYVSKTKPQGVAGHGGPSVQFLVRESGDVVALDQRFFDPDLSGLKSSSLGDKEGHPWTAVPKRLAKASVVYVVEAPIDALCIEACQIPGAAAIATMGTNLVGSIPWTRYRGKQLRMVFDADQPNEFGQRPGSEAMYLAYDGCVAADVSPRVVDQAHWYENGWKDPNDILLDKGIDELRKQLEQFEPWAIPGVPGRAGRENPIPGKSRVFLPSHDYLQYWRYRTQDDFTTYANKVEQEEDGSGEMKPVGFEDVCGFRVVSMNRVTITSPAAIFSANPDEAIQEVSFSVSVKTPRDSQLKRQVFRDDALYNKDRWEKFGPVFAPKRLHRLINIMERTADLAGRTVVNLVGVANKQGKYVVNEGPDCYFEDPRQQCPYHQMIFHRGTRTEAQQVINAYALTFGDNAALQLLVWALGCHIKTFLGFWPHLTIEANKGAGKSTLLKQLERHLGTTVFSGGNLQTAFRINCSLSNTVHPVIWEELSARKQEVITTAESALQDAYGFGTLRRNSQMTETVISAPVVIAGEDVPLNQVLGKLVRIDLTNRKGKMLPRQLPMFPLREWLDFLVSIDPERIDQLLTAAMERCRLESIQRTDDDATERILRNYACVLVAWELVIEFTRMDRAQFQFGQHWIREMDRHLMETKADREPWVNIMEITLKEIDAERYPFPWEVGDFHVKSNRPTRRALFIRHRDIIHHWRTSPGLRQQFDASPMKSAKALSRALMNAGVVLTNRAERRINDKRIGRMLALDVDLLSDFSLTVTETDLTENSPPEE